MTPAATFLSTGHPRADAIERGLGLLFLGMCGGGLISLAGRGTAEEWRSLVVALACLVLAGATVCTGLTNRIEDVPTRSFARTWARWMAVLQDRLTPGASAVALLERSGESGTALMLAVEAMVGGDGDLSREIDRGCAGVRQAREVLDAIAGATHAIVGSVRATTAGLSEMQLTAPGLAEASVAARSMMLGLLTRTAPLADLADQLHRDLQSMSRQSDALVACEPGMADAVTTIRAFATSSMTLLDTMLSTVADLASASERSVMQLQELAGVVLEQHHAGEELSRSVHLQGMEITALLRQIELVKADLMAAQQSGDRAGAMEAARHSAAAAVWRDAAGIPGRAETIARLLRDLPDFSVTRSPAR